MGRMALPCPICKTMNPKLSQHLSTTHKVKRAKALQLGKEARLKVRNGVASFTVLNEKDILQAMGAHTVSFKRMKKILKSFGHVIKHSSQVKSYHTVTNSYNL